MINNISAIGRAIVSIPKRIATFIVNGGAFLIRKSKEAVNYIINKDNKFADKQFTDREVVAHRPKNTADILLEKFNTPTKETLKKEQLSKAAILISKNRFIPLDCNDTEFLDACYLYITKLWDNLSGKPEDFEVNSSNVEAVKTLDINKTSNVMFIGLINMMLNLYYFKSHSNEAKECSHFILELQSLLFNLQDNAKISEIIEFSIASRFAGGSRSNAKDLKINMALFLQSRAKILQCNMEEYIINKPIEEIEQIIEKIFMFSCVEQCSNELAINNINNVDRYLLAYKAISKEDDIKINEIKLPQITQSSQEIIDLRKTLKETTTKEDHIKSCLSKENLASLERRKKIDTEPYLYDNLKTTSIDDSEDKRCSISLETENLVIHEGVIFSYDTFRRIYIANGKNPITTLGINLDEVKRIENN